MGDQWYPSGDSDIEGRPIYDREISQAEIRTELGCRITVEPAPAYLGDGVMLCLRMDDGRYAEVYLDPTSRSSLKDAL